MVPASDLKPGMYLQTWFGVHRIDRIEPYDGPLDWIVGVARFPDGTGISLESHRRYEVV